MPSPNVVNKIPAKKTPDLAQTLARRKSQDFKSKISGWNNTGAGAVQEQDEIVVVEENGALQVSEIAPVEVVMEADASGDDDEAVSTEDETKKVKGTPSTPNTPVSGLKGDAKLKTSRDIDSGRKAWVRRKSKPQVEVSPAVKEAGTPKKRVVSDGHWRRDRVQKIETPTPEKAKEKEKDTTPKPVVVRRSVVSVGLKIPPSVQDFEEEVEPEPSKRRPLGRKLRSRSQSRERDYERQATPDYESSGTKVYIKRRRRSKTLENRDKVRKGFSTSESSLTAQSSIDRPSSETDITTPAASPAKDHPPRPSTAPRERIPSRPKKEIHHRDSAPNPMLEFEAATRRISRRISQNLANDGEIDAARTRKAPHFTSTNEPENRPPNPVAKPFGSRIQGWLNEMPDDPFTEPCVRASLTPEPLDVRPHKSKRPEVHGSDDEVGRRRSSARLRRQRPSLEPIDTNRQSRTPDAEQDAYDDWYGHSYAVVTPTLKRTGARRNTYSPIKDRGSRDASQLLGHSEGPSGLERDRSRRITYDKPSTEHRLSTMVPASQSQPLPSRPRRSSNNSEQLTIIPDGSVLSRASDGDEPVRHGTGLKRRLTKHSDLMSVLSLPREDQGKITSARSIRTRRPRHEDLNTADLMNEISADELRYQRELRTLVDGVIPTLLTYVVSTKDSARTPGSRRSSVKGNQALTQPIYDMGVALEKLKASHRRIPMHDPNELLLWAQSTAKIYDEYLKVWRLGFTNIVVTLAPVEEAEKNNVVPRQGDGERVDVAYLLKRPLVRIKNLTKTLEGISQVKQSKIANDLVATYQKLVSEARRRANEERARLEDEAAAAIDPTRARDPRNLMPLNGVTIDPTRSVRARDFFDMEMFHSSGQQLGCKIEIIRRDNAASVKGSGDVLVCEVAASGKWLLFPPILASYVSARTGDKDGDLVVMVRGMLSNGSEWREVIVLQSSEEQSEEWLQMLGSDPMPPRLTRQSSFNTLRIPSGRQEAPPSPTESEIPIGEKAWPTAPRWDGSEVNSVANDTSPSRLQRTIPARYRSTPSSPLARADLPSYENDDQPYDKYGNRRVQKSTAGPDGPTGTGQTRSQSEWTSSHGPHNTNEGYGVWLPSPNHASDQSSAGEEDQPQRRPPMHRRKSSTPAQDMPTIPKLRKSAPPSNHGRGLERTHSKTNYSEEENDPASPSPETQRQRPSAKKVETSSEMPAAHQSQSTSGSLGLRPGALPSFTPAFMKGHRRSSSPLKHEYAPSTASESSSESGLSDDDDDDDDDASITSHTTADDAISTVGELRDFTKFGNPRPAIHRSARSKSAGDIDTLGPSDSPSQRPYRTVPPTNVSSAKSVACIFSWSETGSWSGLHPEECEIVVTPGLIEAFDLAQAHAVYKDLEGSFETTPSAHGVRPLVALELTPLVPLRRGTALDISIRSPPTSNSVFQKGSNLMFRSRSPEECEKLYALINRARIDNPTWIALQNARGPVKTSNWAEAMDRRNAARDDNPSWIKSLSRKGSTYRSKGVRSASLGGSQASLGTMNSAISAIRRFSGGNIFNIAKSTINSKESTRSSYSDSLSSGAATPLPIDPSMGTPAGITNSKCRFYVRETESKWRDMGSARLTILLPPRPNPNMPAELGAIDLTKRVLVCGKSKGETLLDETLPENAFERVNRTGIAVTVWQDLTGPNGEVGYVAATGGVSSFRSRVYMIQMASEREAAYTFGMVGKLRY